MRQRQRDQRLDPRVHSESANPIPTKDATMADWVCPVCTELGLMQLHMLGHAGGQCLVCGTSRAHKQFGTREAVKSNTEPCSKRAIAAPIDAITLAQDPRLLDKTVLSHSTRTRQDENSVKPTPVSLMTSERPQRWRNGDPHTQIFSGAYDMT